VLRPEKSGQYKWRHLFGYWVFYPSFFHQRNKQGTRFLCRFQSNRCKARWYAWLETVASVSEHVHKNAGHRMQYGNALASTNQRRQEHSSGS